MNQVASEQAGVSNVLANASVLLLPGVEAGAAVEAEPAEPQQARPDQHVDGVVGQECLAAVVLARTDDERRRERRKARRHLDRDAAREVERAALEQPAAAEAPVRQHRVDEDGPQGGEDEERAEAHALDDGARDQRDRDDAEGRLEGEEDELRDRLRPAGGDDQGVVDGSKSTPWRKA